MRGGGAVRGGAGRCGEGGVARARVGVRARARACDGACDMERGGPAACCSQARLPLSRPSPPFPLPGLPAPLFLYLSLSLSLPIPPPRLTDTASPPLSRRPISRSPPLPSPPSQTPFPGMFLRDAAARYWRVCQLGAAAAAGPGPPAPGRSGRTGPRERGIETLCAEAPALIQSTDTVEPNPQLRRDL